MIKGLIDLIHDNGDIGAVVPFSHVEDIKKEYLTLQKIEDHSSWVDRMTNHITGAEKKYIPPEVKFSPCSLIPVVISSPKVILQFTYHGKQVNCTVPPHYADWEFNKNRVLQYITDYLLPRGFSAALSVTFPQKLLAVHSGLAEYGRNNICYNNKFGSYIQILTFISDLPCDESHWFPVARMERCENCRACVKSCPTEAISADRHLIISDRCITLFNEESGEFPEWLDNDAHNSLIGCIKCQDCCPANSHNVNNVKFGTSFTEEETIEILNNNNCIPLSDTLLEKIKATGIHNEWTDHFPRNLALLLNKIQESTGE